MATAALSTRNADDTRRAAPVGLKVPDQHELAPVWDHALSAATPHPAFWLVGAHGGAGASTLARTWAPAGDARRGWPAADRYSNVVVVARTHRVGLHAAHVALRQAAAGLIGECTLLGLVVVADHDGALPKTLRRQLDLVEELAPAAWRVPFIPVYRLLHHDQMPQWSPRDAPAEPPKRLGGKPDPAEVVHPELASIGSAIFAAARAAVTRG
ncbi:DUF6668 family protein [Nocardia asiatica]|uniref:DUF6668 family protein n=1 Tax=Nocardia asiatica TaxID=209252 RepID=UPI00030CDBC7|nr:DUF6668 family protein [Nocardia asiatica]